MNSNLIDRIEQRLKSLNITSAEAARRAKLGESFVRDILRGKTKSPSAVNMAKLAEALQTTPEALMGAEKPDNIQVVEIPVTGLAVVSDVQAGNWLEVTVLEDYEHETIPVARDPRFPRARQYALHVRGDSMDEHYPDGCYVTCVEYWDSGVSLKPGLHVHVERQRAGGQMVEITIKEVDQDDEGFLLIPKSSNEKWQAIRVTDHDDEDVVLIKGIVTGNWRRTQI